MVRVESPFHEPYPKGLLLEIRLVIPGIYVIDILWGPGDKVCRGRGLKEVEAVLFLLRGRSTVQGR